MIATDKIPIITLNPEKIAQKAERHKLLVYASHLPDAYLIRSNEEVIAITKHNGYLRINEEDITSLVEELENIKEDMKR